MRTGRVGEPNKVLRDIVSIPHRPTWRTVDDADRQNFLNHGLIKQIIDEFEIIEIKLPNILQSEGKHQSNVVHGLTGVQGIGDGPQALVQPERRQRGRDIARGIVRIGDTTAARDEIGIIRQIDQRNGASAAVAVIGIGFATNLILERCREIGNIRVHPDRKSNNELCSSLQPRGRRFKRVKLQVTVKGGIQRNLSETIGRCVDNRWCFRPRIDNALKNVIIAQISKTIAEVFD